MENEVNVVEVCLRCVATCEACISDCIESGNKKCIQLCRDCADVCSIGARFEARGSSYTKQLQALCVLVCNACAMECIKHATHHDSCKICAEACTHCATICEEHPNL